MNLYQELRTSITDTQTQGSYLCSSAICLVRNYIHQQHHVSSETSTMNQVFVLPFIILTVSLDWYKLCTLENSGQKHFQTKEERCHLDITLFKIYLLWLDAHIFNGWLLPCLLLLIVIWQIAVFWCSEFYSYNQPSTVFSLKQEYVKIKNITVHWKFKVGYF